MVGNCFFIMAPFLNPFTVSVSRFEVGGELLLDIEGELCVFSWH